MPVCSGLPHRAQFPRFPPGSGAPEAGGVALWIGGTQIPMDASSIELMIPIGGIAAILFALYLARDVLSRDQGTQAMQDVGSMIYEGAVAFIRRQYQTIALIALGAAVVIGLVIG